jgi:predicted nucleotide-binding protein
VVAVYGRGESADAVARFIERLGLKVDVLEESEAVGEGRGTAERLQEQPDVSFAILLLDPGAVGAGPRAAGDAAAADATPTVKEDVIFELGCCVGKLGTKRVCVMYEGGVHAFTDKRGVQYVPIDPAEGWQLQLAKRMRHAGIAVDLNRAA